MTRPPDASTTKPAGGVEIVGSIAAETPARRGRPLGARHIGRGDVDRDGALRPASASAASAANSPS